MGDATSNDILYGEFGRTPLHVFWRRLAERYFERLETQDTNTILGLAYLESMSLHQAGHESWISHYHEQKMADSWTAEWEERLATDDSSKMASYRKIKNTWT